MDTKPTLGEALQDWMGMTEAQKDQQRALYPTRSASLDRLLEKRRELAAKYRQRSTSGPLSATMREALQKVHASNSELIGMGVSNKRDLLVENARIENLLGTKNQAQSSPQPTTQAPQLEPTPAPTPSNDA